MNWREQPRAQRVIIALDTDEPTALDLADELRGHVRWLKVGMTLFDAAGPGIVERLRDSGFDVFLDLKLHDIPHQVEGAASVLSGLGAGMLTVHSLGGRAMVEAAKRGAREDGPAVLAVTLLTSLADADLVELGIPGTSAECVERLAGVAASAGADGIVCSPHEAAAMRSVLGPDALVVTPGIRPGSAEDDQARVAGPGQAFDAGASHIVVGRPVTDAGSPVDAAARIIEEAG